MMSSLMFKFLSHFEFIFVYGMRVCSSSIDLRGIVLLSPYHLGRRQSFSDFVFLPHLSKIV